MIQFPLKALPYFNLARCINGHTQKSFYCWCTVIAKPYFRIVSVSQRMLLLTDLYADDHRHFSQWTVEWPTQAGKTDSYTESVRAAMQVTSRILNQKSEAENLNFSNMSMHSRSPLLFPPSGQVSTTGLVPTLASTWEIRSRVEIHLRRRDFKFHVWNVSHRSSAHKKSMNNFQLGQQ